MIKSWLLSKTEIINALVILGTILAGVAGYLPASWAPYVVCLVAAMNMILRFITKGAISISLPGSLPSVPPIFQASLDAFQNVLASLPPDLGPRAMQLVEQAANGDYPDGAARLKFVLDTLQTEFPGAGTTALRAAIEQLLLLWNQGARPKLAMTI